MACKSLRRRRRVVGAALSFSIGLVAAPFASAEPYIVDAPESGVELGLGWRGTAAELAPNRCVRFAPIQQGGQKATLDLSEVSDSSELQSHLGVSASTSVEGILGSGSASAEFVENANVTSTSTTIAVRAAIQNGALFAGPHRPPALRRYAFSRTEPLKITRRMREPEKPSIDNDTVTLEPWVVEMFSKKRDNGKFDEVGFQKHCGTGFVSGVFSGVEMFSVITFQSSDAETSRQAKVEISAGFGAVVGSAGREAGGSETLKKANTQMSFYQRGGAGGVVPTDRNQLLDKLGTIAREAEVAPEFFDIQVTPYSDLPSYPGEGSKRPVDEQDIVARRYLQLKTLYRDLQAVIDNLIQQKEKAPEVVNYETCYSVQRFESLQDGVRQVIRWIEQAQHRVVQENWDYDKFAFSVEKGTEIDALANLRIAREPLTTDEAFFVSEIKSPFLNWLLKKFSIWDLRIVLPPLVQTTTANQKTTEQRLCPDGKFPDAGQRASYRYRVMKSYVRPVNRRLCETNASDIDCLSNAGLRQLEESIPIPAEPQGMTAGNAGYMCSAITRSFAQCIGGAIDGRVQMRDRQNADVLEFESADESDNLLILKYKNINPAQYLFVSDTLFEDGVNHMFVTEDKSLGRFEIEERRGEGKGFGRRLFFKNENKNLPVCMFSRGSRESPDLYAARKHCSWPEKDDKPVNFTPNAYSWYFFKEEDFK